MKLTTSFALLKKAEACMGRYMFLARALGGVAEYGKDTPIDLLTILETNGVDDCLWALQATAEDASKITELIVADVAESVLHIYEREYPTDKRVRECIQARRAYANGEIDAAARDASWVAARDASWAAAEAAWASRASWAAARVAAEAARASWAAAEAAWAAAWAARASWAAAEAAWASRAAGGGDGDAEVEKQKAILRKYLEGGKRCLEGP